MSSDKRLHDRSDVSVAHERLTRVGKRERRFPPPSGAYPDLEHGYASINSVFASRHDECMCRIPVGIGEQSRPRWMMEGVDASAEATSSSHRGSSREMVSTAGADALYADGSSGSAAPSPSLRMRQQ